jgi:neutral ceramidase
MSAVDPNALSLSDHRRPAASLNRRDFMAAVAGAVLIPSQSSLPKPAWRAGVASVDITPQRSLWMAGFALRKEPSQGVALPLHAKALALRCGAQPAAVLVTVDLLGLTARITDRVAAEVGRRHGVARANLLFNASHTHCGPVVDEQLSVAYDLSPDQWTAIRAYTTGLEDQLIAVIGDALSRLRPAQVAYARGEAGFAANRRVKFTPDGPVDRSVPVLRVNTADGAPLAIVFGYACHNTTLQDGFVQYHGDYAGVAQAALERRHPGATALFMIGCGADANPKPRGTLDLVRAHGAALADAVDRALPTATPVTPALQTAYGTVDLPFVDAAARERWRQQLDIDQVYLRRHAALMEAAVQRDGHLQLAQRDPVQVWRVGSELTLIALGGEVVVDYALRLAREYPGRNLWVAGYCNDVFGYVPSLRVLREGGYEGGDAMIYYGRPGPFTDAVEDLIISEVRRLMTD